MRQLLRLLVLFVLVVTLLPSTAAGRTAAQPELVPDDELVIINRDDRIVVAELSWESPQTGFRQVTTGDFNGDGTAEIVGLRGGEAYVFDPYRQSGEPDVAWQVTATSGQVWQFAATGRFFGDNRDGLVLVQSLSQGNIRARMIVYAFQQGSGWAQQFYQDLGVTFQSLATGDVDGDSREELVGTRNGGTGLEQIIIFDPSLNWATIYEVNYNWPWVALAVGDVQNAGEVKAEIATTRSGVPRDIASFLVLRYIGSSTELQDVYLEYNSPSFQKIALADVTGNREKEVYLLRPGISNNVAIVALTSRNPGADPVPVIEFNELAGQTRFGNIQAGDVDGDGLDEVIVMAADEYIIYGDPANSRSYQSFPGAYSTSLSFAVDNLDGDGGNPYLSVTPTLVNLNLQSGQTATRAVQIANTGGGTLNWTASVLPGASWLSLSSSSGTAPSTLTLMINTMGLQTQEYTGTVRISGQSGATNSPQDVTVTLTVTAAVFNATPTALSWTYIPPTNPGSRSVTVVGTGISWHAGVVPMNSMERIQAAIDAGLPIAIDSGFLVIGDGREDVPIVDYVDVDPSSSSASQTGVTLSLVLNRVPYGLSQVAVVFVADGPATPPAVVVRASILRTLPGATDLHFLPLVTTGQ